MQLVVFIGLQAAGKSSFYRDRFFATHVRINLDMLKTRHREGLLVAACLEAGQPFVVDNTNVSRSERKVYMEAARARGYACVGYYFRSLVEECRGRNRGRIGEVPDRAILGMAGRLERPSVAEGFDELHYVRVGPRTGEFEVSARQEA